MDKRDFSAADVLTAVQTINHHVKDLQKLAKYIDFCLVSEKCSSEQVQLMRREALDAEHDIALSKVAINHYGVMLRAYLNWNYGIFTDMTVEFKNPTQIPSESPLTAVLDAENMLFDNPLMVVDTTDFIIRTTSVIIKNDKFILPDLDVVDLVLFRDKVGADIDMMYDLKDRIMDIALEKDNNDFLYATVVGRQVDDTGRKYVSVSMNGKLYHYPSDELFAEHPDFPIEKFTSGASKKKIFCFEKAEVDDAINTIRNFIFSKR